MKFLPLEIRKMLYLKSNAMGYTKIIVIFIQCIDVISRALLERRVLV
jgi:hypothetical protein